jgi:hypothetical protein
MPQQEKSENRPVQAPSSSDTDTLKAATAVPQIMTELREVMSEEEKYWPLYHWY